MHIAPAFGAPLDEDDEVFGDEAGLSQDGGRLPLAAAGGDQIVQHHRSLAGLPEAFHRRTGTVGLLLQTRVDETHPCGKGGGGGKRQGGDGNARDMDGVNIVQKGGVGPAGELHEPGVRSETAQIDVKGRNLAGFKGELTGLKGADSKEAG